MSCAREATLMHTNTFVQQWSGTRHSTRDPIDASNENISLPILDVLPAFFVTVASGFEIWISETAVHAHYWLVHEVFSTENYSYPPSSGEENPQLWYLFLESAARKIVASLPPTMLPSRLTRLKQTSRPICRSIACPCSDQQSWVLYPMIKVAISTVVSVTRLVMQVILSNMHHSGS